VPFGQPAPARRTCLRCSRRGRRRTGGSPTAPPPADLRRADPPDDADNGCAPGSTHARTAGTASRALVDARRSPPFRRCSRCRRSPPATDEGSSTRQQHPAIDPGHHAGPVRASRKVRQNQIIRKFTHQPHQEDPLAVGGRPRPRHRNLLARLPTPLRHRAHLPVRQEHPGLDQPIRAHPRTGRPVDLAGRRQLHPAPPRPHPRGRPPPALGTTRGPGRLTPARVRREFRRLALTLGTPARPPKSRTPGPGRPTGTRRPPRTRYPAIKKSGIEV
jgi:hypothetical protein